VTFDVACVTDQRYLPWCATSIRSCFDAHDEGEVRIHLLHDGTLESEGIDALQLLAPSSDLLRIHAVDPGRVAHLPATPEYGITPWLRLLLPELLPDVARVLYVDADTLVVDRLSSLADHDLDGSPLGAVANVLPMGSRSRLEGAGLVDQRRYLNSGVLLMDLGRMREEQLLDQIGDAAAAFRARVVWPDQDLLNVVYAGRWRPLHPRFNVQSSLFEWPDLAVGTFGRPAVDQAVAAPAILHFEGPSICKPWHVLSDHPWRARYLAGLAATPFADAGLSDDVWTTRWIRHLPSSWRRPVYEQVVLTRRGAPLARSVGRAAKAIVRRRTTAGSGSRSEPAQRRAAALHAAPAWQQEVVVRSLPYTTSSVEHLLELVEAVDRVVRERVPGVIVDEAPGHGGSSLAMALALQHAESDRHLVVRAEGDADAAALARLLRTSGRTSDRIVIEVGPSTPTIGSSGPVALARRAGRDVATLDVDERRPTLSPGGVLLADG
jgi:lipopolysaccharide biosynthesis glycosyltransferase